MKFLLELFFTMIMTITTTGMIMTCPGGRGRVSWYRRAVFVNNGVIASV